MQNYGDDITNYSKDTANKYNDLNQTFQGNADSANQKLKTSTSGINKYTQDTTDKYSNKINKKGGGIKTLKKKHLINNKMKTKNIKMRTRRSVQNFKSL